VVAETGDDVAVERDVGEAFEASMHAVYRKARAEAGYNAAIFLRMLYDHGGLETARRLLAERNVSDGFTALWQAGRLDLTVEAQVLRPEYAELFTSRERRTARDRLAEHGWTSA